MVSGHIYDSLNNSNLYENESVESLWETIVSSIKEGLKKFIPTKMVSSKNKLPLIKVNLKQLYTRLENWSIQKI